MAAIVESIAPFLALDLIQSQNPQLFPFLLQSTAKGHESSRYDILFACPQEHLVLPQNFNLEFSGNHAVDVSDGFLNALNNWWQQSQPDVKQPELQLELPFLGGWFLYLAYELVNEIEPSVARDIVSSLEDDLLADLPVAVAVRIPVALINDNELGQSYVVIEEEYKALLDQVKPYYSSFKKEQVSVSDECKLTEFDIELKEECEADYLDSIDKIKRYIKNGDVFQVNLSRLWQGKVKRAVSPSMLYQNLCRHNPAPFAGLMYWNESAIVSSSPERLVRVKQDVIETRPIAGTYPRANDRQLDRINAAELLSHPKERAEHIMLIDLERNDMGRICVPGSIHVDAMMTIESYAHVHHIVSNITGKLIDKLCPGDIIRAVFPGGTITGCPKVRCMEIIRELERDKRGPYTGSFGYLNLNGDLDLNILIRTMHITKNSISLRAGAGIVYDSDPEREVVETKTKAKGLLAALGET